MSENNCAVYVHVNLINGKKYFGITVQEPEMRWKNGHGYYNNAHFKNAILKYGWNNFGHFVLYKNIPINIAKNIEEMLIREHMSHDPRFGYNLTYGGELERRTEKTRKALSRAKKGKNNPMYGKTGAAHPMFGKHHSEKTRKAQSERVKGENHPNYGKHLSEETRDAISKALSKPVEAIDPKTGERVHRFKSTQDAGQQGFNQGHISDCCLGKRKTHACLIWRYVQEVNKDDTNSGQ